MLNDHFAAFGSSWNAFPRDQRPGAVMRILLLYIVIIGELLLLGVLPVVGDIGSRLSLSIQVLIAAVVLGALRIGAAYFRDRTVTVLVAWLPTVTAVGVSISLVQLTAVPSRLRAVSDAIGAEPAATPLAYVAALVLPLAVEAVSWVLGRFVPAPSQVS